MAQVIGESARAHPGKILNLREVDVLRLKVQWMVITCYISSSSSSASCSPQLSAQPHEHAVLGESTADSHQHRHLRATIQCQPGSPQGSCSVFARLVAPVPTRSNPGFFSHSTLVRSCWVLVSHEKL